MRGRTTALLGAGLASMFLLSGCYSDADTVSRNLHHEVEAFEVQRRIVLINGITDTVLYEIEGRCSIETDDSYAAGMMEIVCKVGPDEYRKDFLYLSDNAIPIVQQTELVDVSEYHFTFKIKPEQAIPNIEIDTKSNDGPNH